MSVIATSEFSRGTAPTVRTQSCRVVGRRGLFAAFPLLVIASLSFAGTAQAQTVSGITVLGSANPFLAGMPNGSTDNGSDSAPGQSPTSVSGLGLTGGGYLTFSVTGSVDYGGGTPSDPPDGQASGASFYATTHSSSNGIGGYTAPADALVGVFLNSTEPDLSAAPADLNFTGGGGTGISFATLSPQLKQVFFIGDGLTGTGTGAAQHFFIPTGAQRLYLGTVDGSGWFNNTGQFTVSATRVGGAAAAPEPGAMALLALGVPSAAVGLIRRRRKA